MHHTPNLHSRIVVTRPAPDHVDLMRALRHRGYRAIHCPAFNLQAADAEFSNVELDTMIRDADCMIVVSPMAARRTLECVAAEALMQCRIIAPGQATASALVKQGLNVVTAPAPGSSEALLGLPELNRVAAQRIVIVAAPDGRSLLTETLSRRGAKVQRLVLYRREPLAPSSDFLRLLDEPQTRDRPTEIISLISSAMSFEHIHKSLNVSQRSTWLHSHFIVSSDRLKKIVCDRGVQSVQRAASAADVDMLCALHERTRS